MKTFTLNASLSLSIAAVLTGWHLAGSYDAAPTTAGRLFLEPSTFDSPALRPVLSVAKGPAQEQEASLPDPQVLLGRLLAGEDEAEFTQMRADFARSAEPDSIQKLAAHYQDKNISQEQRQCLLETLRVVINPMATAGLRDAALGTDEPALCVAASTGLAKTGTVESVMALTEVYQRITDEAARLQILNAFRHSDPLPEAKGLLQALAERAAHDPWGMAASELLQRTPDPVIDGTTLAAIPQLTPAAK